MRKLPIDLPLKTVTTKVSVGAWDHAQKLKQLVGCRLSDVVSAALLTLTSDQLRAIMNLQNKSLAELPKSVQALLKDLDNLSDDQTAKSCATSSTNNFRCRPN
jgi:hypothetical protein